MLLIYVLMKEELQNIIILAKKDLLVKYLNLGDKCLMFLSMFFSDSPRQIDRIADSSFWSRDYDF